MKSATITIAELASFIDMMKERKRERIKLDEIYLIIHYRAIVVDMINQISYIM